MTEQHAIERAQICFLDEHYGCAETVLLVLQEAYGLDNAAKIQTVMPFA